MSEMLTGFLDSKEAYDDIRLKRFESKVMRVLGISQRTYSSLEDYYYKCGDGSWPEIKLYKPSKAIHLFSTVRRPDKCPLIKFYQGCDQDTTLVAFNEKNTQDILFLHNDMCVMGVQEWYICIPGKCNPVFVSPATVIREKLGMTK